MMQFVTSFLPTYSPLAAGVPWMTYKATRWLDRYLREDMSVFEYGSGGSTVFFAKRVHKVVFVEHDAAWHRQVSEALQRNGLTNCEYLLREPEQAPPDRSAEYRWDRYTSTDRESAGFVFDAYVRSIDTFPEGSFDLLSSTVVLGPRASTTGSRRYGPAACVLDDSDRPEYADAADWLAPRPRKDFRGTSPVAGTLTQGSLWRI